MAPQVLIDFDSVGERIVTAIKSSFDGISKTIVAQTSKQEKQEERSLDVRAQILDPDPDPMYFFTTKEPRATPSMTVIVVGIGTTIVAMIVRPEYSSHYQVLDKEHNQVFLRSGDTDSAEKALRTLLGMTMIMLNNRMGSYLKGPGGLKEEAGGFCRHPHATSR
ncbi:hypothetical protein LTR10_000196 [Elasticomyces elasticus]|nr:hypothetical protein LTR10_000196 [Elasticomyces elasticus]KAK4980545.1 hypothetical protein LTR42_000853 [Elasticomyces elasticus]